MTINKIHTSQKQEESSSFDLSKQILINQKLFLRRPDLTLDIRLYLAIAGLGTAYRDCTILELERKYKVSYTFIYEQANILKRYLPQLFGAKVVEQADKLKELLIVIRFYLEGKLETKSALEGLSNLGASLGMKHISTHFISQVLEIAGTLVSNTYQAEQVVERIFLCDEVYARGQAILVTLDAQSMLVLDIKLIEVSLLSTHWEERFILLKNNNVVPKVLIKDGGTQMECAVKILDGQTLIGADTFHAIPYRLGVLRCTLVKNLDTAKAWEQNRAHRFASTKTYKTALKKEAEWEAAKQKTLQAQDELQWFDEHYFRLLQQLRPFTSNGLPRDKHKASAVMQNCLEALALLDLPQLPKHLKHIKALLDKGELLHFLDQVPPLYQQLHTSLSPNTAWLWMLYWQWDKKACQTHAPKVQQRAKEQAQAAKELLQEHYQLNPSQPINPLQHPNTFLAIKQKVFTTLNQIVQASSLVETFNSILKPFINSARGQVSQALLNLVMFKHNYSPFKRGKRQGKAPIELFTGRCLEKSWLDLLMDQVKAAFVKHGVVSVKKLHQLLCTKEKEKQQGGTVKTLVTPKSYSKAA